MKKKGFIALILGLAVCISAIYMADVYWYSGDVKNGSGLISLFIVLIFCSIGLFLILKYVFKWYIFALIFPFIGAFIIYGIMWKHHNA